MVDGVVNGGERKFGVSNPLPFLYFLERSTLPHSVSYTLTLSIFVSGTLLLPPHAVFGTHIPPILFLVQPFPPPPFMSQVLTSEVGEISGVETFRVKYEGIGERGL